MCIIQGWMKHGGKYTAHKINVWMLKELLETPKEKYIKMLHFGLQSKFRKPWVRSFRIPQFCKSTDANLLVFLPFASLGVSCCLCFSTVITCGWGRFVLFWLDHHILQLLGEISYRQTFNFHLNIQLWWHETQLTLKTHKFRRCRKYNRILDEIFSILLLTSMCLNIQTSKTINFPSRTNGKLMVLDVPILMHLKVHIKCM